MTIIDPSPTTLTVGERKTIASLCSLYVVRMLGLFMVLPVLALYAKDLAGSTPQKVGLALGAYGLTQALFQIPFGMLSDRFGRRRLIYLGLLVFIAGSVVAAEAETINGVIFGRALQGAGAIASTIMALLADLTRDEQRSKAMALIGMSIGLSFALAMVLGPWLSGRYGLHGLFLATALLAGMGMVLLALWVPNPVSVPHNEVSPVAHLFKRALSDLQLVRLYLGIFVLHCVLTALFVILPGKLVNVLGLAPAEHGWVYVPVLFGSFLVMLPLMIGAEKYGKFREAFLVAIGLVLTAIVALGFAGNVGAGVWFALLSFFIGFNLLEAMLPSLVSRQVFAGGRGTAMGVYSTCQFMGIFIGGTAAGWFMTHSGVTGVLAMCTGLLLLWITATFSMKSPPRVRTVVLNYDVGRYSAAGLVTALLALPGVADAMVADGTATAYIKVDQKRFQPESLTVFEAVSG